ncbi:MAG TPA: hypothetical protein VIY86_07485, partial [Pirellulaceae bacterium]
MDRAQTWHHLDGSGYGGNGYIEGIAVSPSYERDSTVFLSVRGRGLFRSCDGGRTFVQIAMAFTPANFLPSHMNEFHPVASPIICSPTYEADRTVYGLSGEHLLVSRDGGDSWVWRPVASGIPTPQSVGARAPAAKRVGFLNPLTSRVAGLSSAIGWTRRKVVKLLATAAVVITCYAL